MFIHPGFTGGSYYGHKGATVEPLCLPRNPEWEIYNDEYDRAKAYVYGAEYQTNTFKCSIKTLHDHDIPCTVCLVRQRSIVQMFPGKYELKKWVYKDLLAISKFKCVKRTVPSVNAILN